MDNTEIVTEDSTLESTTTSSTSRMRGPEIADLLNQASLSQQRQATTNALNKQVEAMNSLANLFQTEMKSRHDDKSIDLRLCEARERQAAALERLADSFARYTEVFEQHVTFRDANDGSLKPWE